MRDTIKLTATAAALILSLVVFGAPPAAAQVNPPSYGTGPGASGLPGAAVQSTGAVAGGGPTTAPGSSGSVAPAVAPSAGVTAASQARTLPNTGQLDDGPSWLVSAVLALGSATVALGLLLRRGAIRRA